MKKIFLLLTCLLLTSTLSGCYSGCFNETKYCSVDLPPSGTPPETPPSETIVAIHLSSTAIPDGERDLLPIDYPAKFSAVVAYEDGTERELMDNEVVWGVSDSRFSIDNAGVIVGYQAADMTVSATFEGESGMRSLSIIESFPLGDFLIEGPVDMLVNTEGHYTASILFDNNRTLMLNYFTDWYVDTDTAEIDAGILIERAAGVTTVTGQYESLAAQSITVNVYDLGDNAVEMRIDSQYEPVIPVNIANQLTAIAVINQEETDITDRVTWDFSACNLSGDIDPNFPGLITFAEVMTCDVNFVIGEQEKTQTLESASASKAGLMVECYDASGNETQKIVDSLQCHSLLDILVSRTTGTEVITVNMTDSSLFVSSDESVLTIDPTQAGHVLRTSSAQTSEIADISATFDGDTAVITLEVDLPDIAEEIVITGQTSVSIGHSISLIATSDGLDVTTSVIWKTDYEHASISNEGVLTILNTAQIDDVVTVSAQFTEQTEAYMTDITVQQNLLECTGLGEENCLSILPTEIPGWSLLSPPNEAILTALEVSFSGYDEGNFPVQRVHNGIEWCEKLDEMKFANHAWSVLGELDETFPYFTIPAEEAAYWPADLSVDVPEMPPEEAFTITGLSFWEYDSDYMSYRAVQALDIGPGAIFHYPPTPPETAIYTLCAGLAL